MNNWTFAKWSFLAMGFAMAIATSVSAADGNPNGSWELKISDDQTNSVAARSIAVDMNNIRGPLDTSFKMCIGAGRANEGLRADWQDQLREAQRDCGFKYIRMHGLLTDDMGVYKEDAHGNPSFNWQYIDQL